MAGGWKAVLQQFIELVNNLSASCRAEDIAPPQGVVTREEWAYNADRISGLLPKFTLASRDQPAKEMCQPLAELVSKALMDHVAMCQLLRSQSSKFLAELACTSTCDVLAAVVGLAEALIKENEAETASPRGAATRPKKGVVTVAFGQATDSCQALQQCPLDDHRAASAHLHKAARMVKDAMKELQKMQSWAAAPDGSGADAPAAEDAEDDWEDFGDDEEQLTEEERAMVVLCEQLVRGSGALLEKLSGMLLKTAPSKDNKAALASSAAAAAEVEAGSWAAPFVELAASIPVKVDDLVAILYEFDPEAVAEAARELLGAVQHVQDHARALPDFEKATEAGMDMAKVFAVVGKICEEAVQTLQPQ